MQKPVRFINPHRRARLIALALLMLAWVGEALFGEMFCERRRLRQRGRYFSLDRLARFTVRLALIRAVELANLRRRLVVRNTAPAGFRRRTASRASVRACIGARLRKRVKRGDIAARIKFLVHALSDLDAFARRHLIARAVRGLTKRRAIVPIAPSSVAIFAGPVLAPATADSS